MEKLRQGNDELNACKAPPEQLQHREPIPLARVLMLCHDQHLDRRVVAQAVTLIESGYDVRLLALSVDGETSHEVLAEGIQLTRIGLNHIIPENPTYKGYIARQYTLNKLLNQAVNRYSRHLGLFQRLFNFGSKLNWNLYKALLVLRYRNRTLHDPLGFRQAFLQHGLQFPSDLVQVHDLPALQAGAELAQTWGVPLVYDAHELYPEQKSFSAVQRRICSQMEAVQITKADLVFAVNESIGEEMAQRYGTAKPVTLLNAIDPPAEFDPDARYDLLRQKIGLSAQRRILLFQGGFAPYRNLETLIKAMAHVQTQDVDLVMLGFGSFGELLKQSAAKLGLLDRRIHFLPAVPQSELLQHTASADLGIIPYPHVDLNSYYCTPNKLFEFIQAGLPILANDSPELNRFVHDNGFGHCTRMKSVKDIARAVDAAFTAPAFSSWRSAIQSKRNELTWSRQGTIYLREMTKLLSPPAQGISRKVEIGAVR